MHIRTGRSIVGHLKRYSLNGIPYISVTLPGFAFALHEAGRKNFRQFPLD
jgi:hypothetical protein